MLERIHLLSALIPPKVGTAEHIQLTQELEDLVKLVEAVKLVDRKDVEDTDDHEQSRVPDGRVWAQGVGIDLTCEPQDPAEHVRDKTVGGRALLDHAVRTANGLYVVEADKHRSS